jgi:hypothetical protein
MLYNYYFDPNNIILTIVCCRNMEVNNNFEQDHKIHEAGDVTSQLAIWLYSRLI